jgi:hypothetical protein
MIRFAIPILALVGAATAAVLLGLFAHDALYRLRLIDSLNFWDSDAESKQVEFVVMIRQRGHNHDDDQDAPEQH